MATIEVADETLRELTTLLGAIRDSATPGLAQRVSEIMANLGAVAAEVEPDRAGPLVQSAMQTAPSLAQTLMQLDEWHRTGVWDSLSEWVSFSAALKDGVTPQIAERVATLVTGLGQLASEIGPGVIETASAVESHGPVLREMIDDIAGWHQDGTWNMLTEMVTILRALNDSLTPDMVGRLVDMLTTLGSATAAALDSGLLEIGIRLADALTSADKDAAQNASRITAMGLLRSLKEPEIQRAVKTVMAVMRRLPGIVEDPAHKRHDDQP